MEAGMGTQVFRNVGLFSDSDEPRVCEDLNASTGSWQPYCLLQLAPPYTIRWIAVYSARDFF